MNTYISTIIIMIRGFVWINILLLIHIGTAYSQSKHPEIFGKVLSNKDGKPIQNVTIVINNKRFGTSNKQGIYNVNGIADKQLIIKFSCVGYKSTIVSYKVEDNSKSIKLPDVRLNQEIVNLDEVIVSAKAIPMIQKGDTIEFNVVAFKLQPNATARQLVDALPGMTRDANDKLHYNGKKVQSVKIDNRVYHDNVDVTLNAIPADIVEKVQVFDDASELAKFTGFDDGHRRTTINLVTKYKNLKFGVGRYEAAAGNKNNYALYTTNSLFLGASRLHISGNANNINRKTEDDILSNNNALGRNQIGDIKSSYSWNHKNTKIYADYLLSTNDKKLETDLRQEYFNEDRIITDNNISSSFDRTHKGNMRISTYLGKKNRIIFRPYFGKTKINRYTDKVFYNIGAEERDSTINRLHNNGQKKFFKGTLAWLSLLSPKFYLVNKLRTDYSQNNKLNTLVSNNNEDNSLQYMYDDKTNELSHDVGLTYMFKKNTAIAISNKLSYRKEEYSFDIISPKARELNYIKHRCMLGFICNKDFYNSIRIYLGYETTKTANIPLKKDYNSIVASVDAKFKLKKSSKGYCTFEYNRNARTPNIEQLYGIPNIVNPLLLLKGNINLKQSYYNNIKLNSTSYMGRFGITSNIYWYDNYIAGTTNTDNGKIIESYKNSSKRYGCKVSVSRTRLTNFFRLSYDYNNVPSYYNDQLNISKQNTVSFYAIKMLKQSKYKYALNNVLSYNWSNNSLGNVSRKFLTNKLSGKFQFDNGKYFIGIEGSVLYDYQPDIEHSWRKMFVMEVGRRFCNNRLEVSLVCRDLFNENFNKQIKFSPSYVKIFSSNDITRTIMFSLKYHFNTLKNKGGMKVKSISIRRKSTF